MLNGSNTYGFLKCRYGSEQSMSKIAKHFFGKQILNKIINQSKSTIQTTMSPQQVNEQFEYLVWGEKKRKINKTYFYKDCF